MYASAWHNPAVSEHNPPLRVPVAMGAIVSIIATIAFTGVACRNSTPEETPSSAATETTRTDLPLSLDWTDADLEKMAQRIGYGSNPSSVLARNAEGVLTFIPQTNRDHIATEFIELAKHDGDRSLELILDVRSPGGQSCEASLQDQAFNMLATVPCRDIGEHRATARLSDRVSSVRLYFESPRRERVQLPIRVQVVEHR